MQEADFEQILETLGAGWLRMGAEDGGRPSDSAVIGVWQLVVCGGVEGRGCPVHSNQRTGRTRLRPLG